MTTQESVVTPQRFDQGRTFDDYLQYIGSPQNLKREGPRGGARPDNSERFQRNIDQYEIKPEHVQALKALPKLKMLVIGEDWCPDVYRGLPVLAKICETAGWELRIFQRDDNKDMIAEFLNEKDGQQFQSIPTAVLYTTGHQYLGHWIERPKVAETRMKEIAASFTRQEGESEEEMRDRLRARYRELQAGDEWASWRHATVDEIIALVRANT